MRAARTGHGSRRRRAATAAAHPGGAFEAEVAAVSGGGRAQVRRPGGPSSLLPCEVAVPGYQPRPGDRVVVTAAADGLAAWITGVLMPRAAQTAHPAADASPTPATITAPAGATASLAGGALVLRDPAGALVATYDPARSTLRIGEGLSRVEIGAADGTVAIAARDIQLRAATAALVEAPELSVNAGRATLKAEHASVSAALVHTAAEELSHTAARWEVSVGRLIERASEAYREAELAETRAERARTLVKAAFDVITGRTTLLSDDDTIIDGKRVLLG